MSLSLLSEPFFEKISTCIDNLDSELHAVSLSIWNKPEMAYEEHYAHDLLTDHLESHGFTVHRNFHLPTAFYAEFVSRDFDPAKHSTVCFLSEYDALPTIGHACGHNLIAITGVGAAVAVKKLLVDNGRDQISGKVVCMGTPAEETTGGKIDLLQTDAFTNIDFCIMAHPSGNNIAAPDILGLLECEVAFCCDSAEAGIRTVTGCTLGNDPSDAQQAVVDASIALYAKLSLFRQQLQTGNQIHGVIYHAGVECLEGKWTARSHYYLRSPTVVRMQTLKEVFQNAVDAAASFSGCQRKCDYAVIPFEGLISNQRMAGVYQHYAEKTGMTFPALPPSNGSTDMGNLSNIIPSIHPMYRVTSAIPSPNALLIHTREFQVAAGSQEAHRQTLNATKALAMTGLELLLNRQFASAVKEEFWRSRETSRGVIPECS